VLSGGLDAQRPLQPAPRFFAAGPGTWKKAATLTIMATRPPSTPGSRMDDVNLRGFKGTGNMEVHLDRRLMDKRIFPDHQSSESDRTQRKESLLKDEAAKWLAPPQGLSQLTRSSHGAAARTSSN